MLRITFRSLASASAHARFLAFRITLRYNLRSVHFNPVPLPCCPGVRFNAVAPYVIVITCSPFLADGSLNRCEKWSFLGLMSLCTWLPFVKKLPFRSLRHNSGVHCFAYLRILYAVHVWRLSCFPFMLVFLKSTPMTTHAPRFFHSINRRQ